MSYIDRGADPGTNARAAIAVAAVHAAIGGVLIAGLTFSGVLNEAGRVITFDVPTDPIAPPPPDPVDVPPDSTSYVAPTAPLPPIPIGSRSTTVEEFDDTAPVGGLIVDPMPVVEERVELAQPTPTPSIATSLATRVRPLNNPARWITTEDYPSSDIRRGNEGTAHYRLVIGSDGGVDACEITISSGASGLDRATCRLLERRAEFAAARNAGGDSIVGTYTGSVSWELPE